MGRNIWLILQSLELSVLVEVLIMLKILNASPACAETLAAGKLISSR